MDGRVGLIALIYYKSLDQAREKIISLFPQFANSTFEADDTGWCNFVVKVDGNYIFRFSKDDESYSILENETRILKSLLQRFSQTILLPDYEFSHLEHDGPFVGYKMIKGTFITRDKYLQISQVEKDIFAEKIALFLTELHSLDVKEYKLEYRNPTAYYETCFHELMEICQSYLSTSEKEMLVAFYKAFEGDILMKEYIPSVVHGDLSDDHIILTSNGIGIIDFGDVMVFDPAYDFLWTFFYDEELFDKIYKFYNGNKDENFKHRIQNFYLKWIPYYSISYGNKIGNRELVQQGISDLKRNIFS